MTLIRLPEISISNTIPAIHRFWEFLVSPPHGVLPENSAFYGKFPEEIWFQSVGYIVKLFLIMALLYVLMVLCMVMGERNRYRRHLKGLIQTRPERREEALRWACEDFGVEIEEGERGGGEDEGYNST